MEEIGWWLSGAGTVDEGSEEGGEKVVKKRVWEMKEGILNQKI